MGWDFFGEVEIFSGGIEIFFWKGWEILGELRTLSGVEKVQGGGGEGDIQGGLKNLNCMTEIWIECDPCVLFV